LLVVLPAIALHILHGGLLESPAWLLTKEPAKASSILALLRGQEDGSLGIQAEMEMMRQAPGGEPSSKKDAASLLTTMRTEHRILKGMIICVICCLAQQFSGINNVFNYSSAFLEQNNIPGSVISATTVMMNLGNVISPLAAIRLMDTTGRRILLLASTLGMAISIVLLSLAFTLPVTCVTSPLAVIAIVGFVASFGIGLGPIPWLLPAELFPVTVTSQGCAFSATVNWLSNFIVVQFFPVISAALAGFCFMPFVFVLLPFAAFVHWCIPETRGKTIQQIGADLDEGW